jgi:hypothetical protein
MMEIQIAELDAPVLSLLVLKERVRRLRWIVGRVGFGGVPPRAAAGLLRVRACGAASNGGHPPLGPSR